MKNPLSDKLNALRDRVLAIHDKLWDEALDDLVETYVRDGWSAFYLALEKLQQRIKSEQQTVLASAAAEARGEADALRALLQEPEAKYAQALEALKAELGRMEFKSRQ